MNVVKLLQISKYNKTAEVRKNIAGETQARLSYISLWRRDLNSESVVATYLRYRARAVRLMFMTLVPHIFFLAAL